MSLKARLQSLWVRTRDFVVSKWAVVNNRPLTRDTKFFVKTSWASPLAWFPILGTMLAAMLVVINYTCEMPLATRKFVVTTGFGGLVYFLPLLWQSSIKDFHRISGFFLPTLGSLLLNVGVTLAWAFSIHYIASLAGGTSFWRSMYLNGSNFHSAAADSWLVLAGAITLLASFITLRILQKMEWRERWSPYPNQGGSMNSRAPPPNSDDPKKPAKEEAKPSTSAAGKDDSKPATADDEICGHPV